MSHSNSSRISLGILETPKLKPYECRVNKVVDVISIKTSRNFFTPEFYLGDSFENTDLFGSFAFTLEQSLKF